MARSRSLSILEPCDRSWESLEGDGSVRRCSECDKHVHDLQGRTEREIEALFTIYDGALCGRVERYEDGAIRVADVTRRRPVSLFAALTAAVIAVPSAALAQAGASTPPPASQAPPTSATVADADGDTIPDSTDACPTQAGPPNANPARHGCPSVRLVQLGGVSSTSLAVHRAVFFEERRDRLLPRSIELLEVIATTLAASPDISEVIITGHADASEGNASLRRSVSQQRAQRVLEWLAAHGVDRARMRVESVGSEQPIAAGRDRNARAQNRRATFRVGP